MNINYRLGELFSGPGGLALAATSARVDAGEDIYSISHAWATDYDKDTCETYRRNICPDNPKTVVHDDIRQLKIERLEKISKIDALAFGFPCNDFSIVGEQKGIDGVFGPLYQYGIDVLKHFQLPTISFSAAQKKAKENKSEWHCFHKFALKSLIPQSR